MDIFRYPIKITYQEQETNRTTTVDLLPAIQSLRKTGKLLNQNGADITGHRLISVEFDQEILAKIQKKIGDTLALSRTTESSVLFEEAVRLRSRDTVAGLTEDRDDTATTPR